MEGVVQCPVCTLFLHPGMDLAEHLETHPKDQVIQALSQMTLQRANILTPQFVAKPLPAAAPPPPPPPPPPPQPQPPQQTVPATTSYHHHHPQQVKAEEATTSGATTTTAAVLIQVPVVAATAAISAVTQQQQAVPPPLNNSTPPSSSSSSQQIFNKQSSFSYVNEPQKSVMIVNSCSTQFIQQRIHPQQVRKQQTSQMSQPQQLEIAYTEPAIQIVPRYTSEKYSGPPPPYSTAISSSSLNNTLTTLATPREAPPTLVCSSTENSGSSYEVKAHFSGHDVSAKSTSSYDGSCSAADVQFCEEQTSNSKYDERQLITPPPFHHHVSVKDEYILPELETPSTVAKDGKASPPVKVLSNVKIEGQVCGQGLQEILLKKGGKRTSRILNKKPTMDDPASPAPLPAKIEEVMDLTQSAQFDVPSTSSMHDDTDLTVENMEIEEIHEVVDVDDEEDIDNDNADDEENEEERQRVTATPTSVIRTIGCNSPKPSTSAETVTPPPPPPAPLPPPAQPPTKKHLLALHHSVTPSHAAAATTSAIGRPIVSKPKKLTLKLKTTNPVAAASTPMPAMPTTTATEHVVKIKTEPGVVKTDERYAAGSHGTDDEIPSSSSSNCCLPAGQMTVKRERETRDDDTADMFTDPNTASSYIITYVNDENSEAPTSQHQQHADDEIRTDTGDASAGQVDEKVQYPTMVLHEEIIPMSWVQRFSPQYVPFDERSTLMDLDGFSKNSNSAASVQSTSNSYDRAPSTESLNIRTDEKMPAKGEISEQESNGEVDHWNQIYNDGVAQYPSSFDVSQAQECWNLSQSKTEIPQFGSFPPLQLEENARETSPDSFIPKEEKDFDVGMVEKHDATKPKKIRNYRCHDCIKTFQTLKERRLHQAAEHPVSNEPSCSGGPTGGAGASVVDVAGCSRTYVRHQFEGLSSMLTDGGLGQIVENFQIVKQEISTTASSQLTAGITSSTTTASNVATSVQPPPDIKAFIVQPSLITEEQFHAIRSESKKMMMLYKCDTCHDEYKNLKTFNKHFSTHPAECALCGRGFTRWATFTLHLKRHYNIRDYECRLCNKSFILRQKLVEHMRIHTGNAPIQCNVCFARFRRYSNLAQHRNRHHLNKRPYKKDYVCECGETFVSQAKLNWHRETHENKPKVCPFCRERFIHLNSLTRHIRLSHPAKYSIMKNKTVQCPFCDQKYLQTSLKAHLETHSKTKNQYSCQICNKEFSTKWNLKQHQWTHANRSSKPFQCNVCSNAFVRENDYVTHMNAHKSIRPYTCNHCGCQFVRKSNWMRHTREHEQEKSYTCDVCNKRFHRAYYLTEHRRVHTGERPFTCTICGKKSATKTNHNKHIKIHHARDPLTAEG